MYNMTLPSLSNDIEKKLPYDFWLQVHRSDGLMCYYYRLIFVYMLGWSLFFKVDFFLNDTP